MTLPFSVAPCLRGEAFVLLFLSALICPAQQPTTGTKPWQKIPVPPLHTFHPREPIRVELPNGLVILLMEDHELPLIDGALRIRGGSREEPAAKAGMLDLYPDAWRTGGPKTRTRPQIDDHLAIKPPPLEPAPSPHPPSLP